MPRSHEEARREVIDSLIEYHGATSERIQYFEPFGVFHKLRNLFSHSRNTFDRAKVSVTRYEQGSAMNDMM